MFSIRSLMYVIVSIILGVLINALITGASELDRKQKAVLYTEIVILILYVAYKFNKVGGVMSEI